MATIGDVLGVVAFLLGLGLTAWAMTIAAEVLFPQRANVARETVEGDPKRTFVRGLLFVLGSVIPGIAFLSNANPLAKLIGWMLILAVLALGALGCAGLGRLASHRLREMDASMTEYASFARGAALIVASSMFPILGWFLVGPALFIVAVGAGSRAIRQPQAVHQPLSESA